MEKTKKDTIKFFQTIDNSVYKRFYNVCKEEGVTVQEKIRGLIVNYLKEVNN